MEGTLSLSLLQQDPGHPGEAGNKEWWKQQPVPPATTTYVSPKQRRGVMVASGERGEREGGRGERGRMGEGRGREWAGEGKMGESGRGEREVGRWEREDGRDSGRGKGGRVVEAGWENGREWERGEGRVGEREFSPLTSYYHIPSRSGKP